MLTYFYNTTKKMHLLSQIIYSCKMLYMFRTVFPSIIRSSRLHIQQQAYVKQLLLAGLRLNCCSISSQLPAGSSSCLTYACFYMCSLELLMMDGKTVRNM